MSDSDKSIQFEEWHEMPVVRRPSAYDGIEAALASGKILRIAASREKRDVVRARINRHMDAAGYKMTSRWTDGFLYVKADKREKR